MNQLISVGDRFGIVVVLEERPRNKYQDRVWLCRCDCGREWLVSQCHLRTKRSCGCTRAQARRSHGAASKDKAKRPPEYSVWCDIKKRCANKTGPRFADYGGRGIVVAEPWNSDFNSFLKDMGPRPSKDHSIDRIDNDGPYAPGNCQWATRVEQGANKRNNVWLQLGDRKMTVAQWSREVGLTEHQISNRLKLGWSHERALTEPLKPDCRRTPKSPAT